MRNQALKALQVKGFVLRVKGFVLRVKGLVVSLNARDGFTLF